MKHLFCLLAFAFCVFTTNAQDLLVTNAGDSINCKILNQTNDEIIVEFVRDGQVKSTTLPLEYVSVVNKDFYSLEQKNNKSESATKTKHQHFSVAISSGLNIDLAAMGDETINEELRDQLINGFHIAAKAAYYFNNYIGISTSASKNYSSADIKSSSFKSNLQKSFVGAGAAFRMRLGKESLGLHLFANIEMGATFLNEKTNTSYSTITTKACSFGINETIGAELQIIKNLYLGLHIESLSSVFFTTEQTTNINGVVTTETIELELDDYIALNNLSISAGIRYAF